MSREIKFRAWHNTAEKYLQHGSNRQIFSWQDEGQDITIEQFTGLKDRNGVEIYEGDVVYDDYFGYKYEVIFNPRNASFALKSFDCYKYFDDDVSISDITVTGNIHTKTSSDVQP